MKKILALAQAVVLFAVISSLAWGDPVLHPAANLVGTVPVAKGGTGSDNAAGARANLGLGAVDNTSDVNKPVSTATQSALDGKQAGSATLSDLSDGILTNPLVFNDDVYAKFGTDNDFTVRYKSADGTLVIALDNGDAQCTFSKTGGLTCTGEATFAQYGSSGTDNTFGINMMNTEDPSGANLEAGMFWFNGTSNIAKQRNADNTATVSLNARAESFVIYNYSASHDNVVRWQAGSNLTLTQLSCNTGGTDNVTVTLYECDANVANCATTGLVAAATSTTVTDSSASNGSIDVNDWIKVSLSSLQGTATSVACTVRYVDVGN